MELQVSKCILYTIYYILYTIYYILYTIYYILYTIYSILYIIYYILSTIYYILYTIYSILYTFYYILYTIHYILYTIYYILYTIQHTTIYYSSQVSLSAEASKSRRAIARKGPDQEPPLRAARPRAVAPSCLEASAEAPASKSLGCLLKVRVAGWWTTIAHRCIMCVYIYIDRERERESEHTTDQILYLRRMVTQLQLRSIWTTSVWPSLDARCRAVEPSWQQRSLSWAAVEEL